MKVIRDRFLRKMNSKILLYSIVIGLISIISSSVVYRQINDQLIVDTLSKENKQTSIYVKSNIDNVINSVNSYSKLIISNDQIRKVLDQDSGIVLDQQAVLLQLNIMMESTPFISGIYLSDMKDNIYLVFKEKDASINFDYRRSSLVEEVIKDNGSYSIHFNGGDYFVDHKGQPFVSFARAVRDLNTQEIIGVLVINIPVSHLVSDQASVTDGQVRELYIVKEDEIIAHTGGLEVSPVDFTSVLKKEKGYTMAQKTNNGKSFMISSDWIESLDWHVVSVISLDQSEGGIDDYKKAFVLIFGVNLVFIFLGVTLFSRFFVHPINRMITKIRHNGENLHAINLRSKTYELNQLEMEYNDMILKIKALIHNKVNEQKSLRKKELELLQSQIKPHFLYNTLDTIKLLSKKGDNEMAFQAVSALGKFYRSSLGKGEETISISEEVKIVDNYMKIQKFRYGEIFDLDTDLDPGLKDHKVLRLILQPLVENALYHGIRPKGEPGLIKINIYREHKHIKFLVEDDGVGFDTGILSEKGTFASKLNGFGVNNTIERLKIFYGNQVEVSIESRRGIGTKVLIAIPLSATSEGEILSELGGGNHV